MPIVYAPVITVYDTAKTLDLYLLDYLTGQVYKTANASCGNWGASGYATTQTNKEMTELGTASGIYLVDVNDDAVLAPGWYRYIVKERAGVNPANGDTKVEWGKLYIDVTGVEIMPATKRDIQPRPYNPTMTAQS